MKSLKLILILGLLILGLTVWATAQDAEISLYNKIVPAVEKGEPQWKLRRKAIMPNQLIIQWILDQDRTLVSVTRLTSQGDAQDRLAASVKEWAHIPEAKVTTHRLKDFDDEGYLLKTAGVKGAHILFRKGAFLTEVFAPADDVAQKFAQHVADILPPSNKSLDRAAGGVFRSLIHPSRPVGIE